MPSSLIAALFIAAPPTAPAAPEAPPAPYAEVVLQTIEAASPAWLKKNSATLRREISRNGNVLVLEATVGADGALLAERVGLSTGDNALDDQLRIFLLEIEPLPPPNGVWLDTTEQVPCLLRLRLALNRRKPTLVAATACMMPDDPVGKVAGVTLGMSTAKDASAHLFRGWQAESSGEKSAALASYRQAVKAEPAWDLASRALGLALVNAKKAPQAIPYLKTYVRARAGATDAHAYAREIDRFEKVMAERIAKQNRVRDRLSKNDILFGIKKSYPLLEPCLRRARAERRLAVGSDTLVLTWSIRKDGSAHSARVEGPESLMMTDHADCIARVVTTWRFPKFSAGSEITATRVPIKVRGASRPAAAAAAVAGASAAPDPVDEPTFAMCERSPDEIGGHIRSRQGRMRACILAERRRNPKAPLPENLPITLVIDSAGPIRSVALNHRAYRDGPLATCVQTALSGSLAPTEGADCPAEFGVDLRGMMPARRF